MKSFLVGLASLLSVASFGQSFRMQANCYLNSGSSAYCQVCNYEGYTMLCNIRSRGMTSQGYWINNQGTVRVHPGQCAHATVYANNPRFDPLVDASASANCRF